MRRYMSLAGLCLLFAVVGREGGPHVVAADEPATAAAQDDRERRVVLFVQEHQPELAKVLAHLAKSKPADYARAIEELDRSVQPLIAGKAKDPRLHELGLLAWQARTRVDLLAARLVAGKVGKGKDREQLEQQLREAIAMELDIRAEQLAYRKQRSAAWYDRQIQRLSEKRDALITARLKSLVE